MKFGYPLLLILLLAGSTWLLLGRTAEDAGDDMAGDTDPAREGPTGLVREAGPSAPAGAGASRAGAVAPRAGGEASRPGRTPANRPHVLVGRVIDERRVRVAGAAVELRAGARILAEATSDAEGRYRLELASEAQSPRGRIALFARTTDGRGAVLPISLFARAGPERTLPVLIVRRAFDLDVRVVRRGKGVPGARVAALRSDGASPILLETEQADAEGRARFVGLTAGRIELFAAAPGHGRGMHALMMPRPDEAGPCAIELGEERELRVHVADAVTQRPVSGAEVIVGEARTLPPPIGPGYVPALPRLRTNRRGQVVVRGLSGTERVFVSVRASGYVFAHWSRAKTQVAAPNQTEIRVAISRPRRVRFPVGVGEVPAPLDGTALAVAGRGAAGANRREGTSARMERGYVVLHGLGPGGVTGTFIAPSGAQATYSAPPRATEGPTLTFRMPRTLRLRAVGADGVPVPGLTLGLDVGGGAIAPAPAVTDGEGVAQFEVLDRGRATVHLLTSEWPLRGRVLVTLDLGAGRDVHEVVLPAGIRLVLTLRIDGDARLPATYTLLVGGQPVDPAHIEEDPRAGRLVCEVRPVASDDGFEVELHAPGFLPETFEADVRDGDIERRLFLRPEGRLVAWVTPPQGGGVTLQLQRHDASKDAWLPVGALSVGGGERTGRATRDPEGAYVYEGLGPGRYRVFDRRSREASDAAEVSLGAQVELRLDLSRARWIHGRVVGPDDTNLALARVLVVGRDDASSPWNGVRPTVDGSFRVPAYRDAPLTLRVVHPLRAPAERGGRATVRAGDGDVELRLERGPLLEFRVAGHESATTPPSGRWRSPVTVHLLPETPVGRLGFVVLPIATDGVFQVGCARAGRYTLWVMFEDEETPYVKRGLELAQTPVDLGTLVPASGSTLRIEIEGLQKRPGALVRATVTHEGEPAYTREGSLDRTTGAWVCHGLGPGRFRVVVRGLGAVAPGVPSGRTLLDRVVVVDGEHDLTLNVRLP